MQNRRLIQSAVLAAALAVACLGAGAGIARADVITFDVRANLTAGGDGASCSAAGCVLGGTLVVNNSPGAANGGFVSADVTMSGETPAVGPFTVLYEVVPGVENGQTLLGLYDPAFNFLFLGLATPTKSLVGFDGGALVGYDLETTSTGPYWDITSGSLTPTPEPASFLLFGTGLLALAGFFALRKNKRSAASFGVR